ncbi:Pyrophosphate--fructose 6-phosphate 1-phosphotransferase subunit alpha [Apostasia shenzhenica]|uniref:Pyrophosphate--fructose 6-phosphate 1-phosphotransferase subunit alpha n=1 Tax=Apostasia shenzhenica TaxID=1088818 RepID=A0A2I0AYQ0_9ASPA|nr:Pyrophosphate--fructose 6-phosphate 1-phosphotransferase subunit alpha [Apostasia shenzhenica]
MDFGAAIDMSCLQKQRSSYIPELPNCLQGGEIQIEMGEPTTVADSVDAQSIQRCFPLTYGQPLVHFVNSLSQSSLISSHGKEQQAVKIGVVFCGRQSPGGHNVICGLYNAIKSHNSNGSLIGFCGEDFFDDKFLNSVRDQQYNIFPYVLKTGGTKGLFAKDTVEITEEIISTYQNQGGYGMLGRTIDQIRTTEQVNAAIAACQSLSLTGLVIIGGVTSNTDAAQLAETFAEAECSTKVIGVPVSFYGDLKNQFVEANVGFDTVCKVNSELVSNLCTDALSAEKEIHALLKKETPTDQISANLSPWASALFESMPAFLKRQLLLSPDSDESAQLSQIETEKLLAKLVETEMEARTALGHVVYHLIAAGVNGYMATVTNLKHDVTQWRCGGAPFTAMMTVRRTLRGPGSSLVGKPSIHPVAVDLKGKPYELLLRDAERFLTDDLYANPGPLQYKGPGSDSKTISLLVEDQDYMGKVKELQAYIDKVKKIVKPGCSQEVLKVALSSMASVVDILSVMSPPSKSHNP